MQVKRLGSKVTRPIITLLTDFGTKDSYVGVMKGIISGINPDANAIDLCHEIGHQDIFEGAYILYSSYKFFPEGTTAEQKLDTANKSLKQEKLQAAISEWLQGLRTKAKIWRISSKPQTASVKE